MRQHLAVATLALCCHLPNHAVPLRAEIASHQMVSVLESEPTSPPHIQFERSIADMGTLSAGKGEQRKAEFRYTNTGKAPLVIEAAEVDCGCTTVQFSKKPLKPGKTGKLKVTFNATNLEERGVVGNVVTIFVNSPQRYTRIRIKAVLTD